MKAQKCETHGPGRGVGLRDISKNSGEPDFAPASAATQGPPPESMAARPTTLSPDEIEYEIEQSGQNLRAGFWIIENGKHVCILEYGKDKSELTASEQARFIYRWRGLRLVHNVPTMFAVRAPCYLYVPMRMRIAGYYTNRQVAERIAAEVQGDVFEIDTRPPGRAAWSRNARTIIQGGRAAAPADAQECAS